MDNYKHILDLVNKDHDNDSWVKFYKKFEKEGKQGIAGLVKIDGVECVYKSSRHLDFQMNHEAIIMNGLNTLYPFCPFFCRSFGLIQHPADHNYKKKDNPFEITTQKPIIQDTLLMEYLPFKDLYSLIKDTTISDNVILACVKQVLLAISIAQRHKKFTHYDLHSCNILMKPCNVNKVYLFVIDKENQIIVPTYGWEPKIIDFGFSYIQDMENQPIYTSLAHTEVGFLTSLHDPISDLKLFLITVSNELKIFRSGKTVFKFRNIIRNIFEPLNVDWESGWDEPESEDESGAADIVSKAVEDIKHSSHIFDRYNHYCIDQLQSLIILPLSPKNSDDLEISYKMLTSEITRIEKLVGNSFTNLYILKKIITIARELRKDYYNKHARDSAVLTFKKRVQEILASMADYCNPPVNYEKLFCSLLVFSNCMKGILYSYMQGHLKKKLKEYAHLKLTAPEHMICVIEANIDENYVFSSESEIIVLDCIKKSSSTLSLTEEQCTEINKLHSFFQGRFLYEKNNK